MANCPLKLNPRLATNCDKFIAAFCRSVSSRDFSYRTWQGMVSNQNERLHISESRHKSRSSERIKFHDDWRTERVF